MSSIVRIAATGVILAALYLLWAYQRVFHGEPDEENQTFAELKVKEGLVLLPFLGLIVFMGVYPKPVLDRIEPAHFLPAFEYAMAIHRAAANGVFSVLQAAHGEFHLRRHIDVPVVVMADQERLDL